MKIKKGFVLHEVCGNAFVVAEGQENINFDKIITLTDSSAFLWKKIMCGHAFELDDLVSALTAEYEVEESVARDDCESLLQSMVEYGIIE